MLFRSALVHEEDQFVLSELVWRRGRFADLPAPVGVALLRDEHPEAGPGNGLAVLLPELATSQLPRESSPHVLRSSFQDHPPSGRPRTGSNAIRSDERRVGRFNFMTEF